jgi:putative transposase
MPADAVKEKLFDNWFDPIETEPRRKVRGFIEAMIDEELEAALARPRYGRRSRLPVKDDAAATIAGYRHGRRIRSLTGTFGPTEITVPRARIFHEGGKDQGMEEQGAAGLSAPHPRRRCADCFDLSFRNQHAPGPPGAGSPVRRHHRKGYGQPGLAQGERRLGHLERTFTCRRADHPVDPRWNDGARPARQEIDIDILAHRARHQTGRPKDGRRERSRLADASRRSHQRGLKTPEVGIVDGAPGLEKALAALWSDVLIQRCSVHKHRNLLAHAPDRLHEISADYRDMIYADTAREIDTRRRAFLRKWRMKCPAVTASLEEAGDKLFTFTRFPKSQWKSIRTSNAIERLHEEFKRRIKTQTDLPSAETAAMLFWALLASGQITMCKVDGWQSLGERPSNQSIELAA